jgi:hypothetical protein
MRIIMPGQKMQFKDVLIGEFFTNDDLTQVFQKFRDENGAEQAVQQNGAKKGVQTGFGMEVEVTLWENTEVKLG